MGEPKLYTSPEAAQALGVSDSHMRNMIRTGIAHPKCAIGGTWMFTPDEIERLRHRKRTPGKTAKQKPT